MTDKIQVGGLYRFHAPKLPGVFSGPFECMRWTIWEDLDAAFDQTANQTAKFQVVEVVDGTIILFVDYKSRPLFNMPDNPTILWLYKVLINDVCGWTLIDRDPELWDNYMTTFDDRLERL